MAEHVSIPAGFNPATAVPGAGGDVTTYGSANRTSSLAQPGTPPAIPPVAPATQQTEGFTPPPAAPAGVDPAQFAAFQAWQAAEAAKKAAPAPVTPPAPAPAAPAAPVAEGEGIGAEAAMDAVRASGDALVGNTFEMLDLLVPGLDLNRALGNAIDRADPSLLDRAYLREKAGDKAEKVVKLAENLVNHVNRQVEQVVSDLHASAGGQAGWDAAAAAFSKDAPAHLKAWAVDLLNSANPTKIKTAAAAIVDFAKKSGAVVVQPQGHVRAGGGVPNAALGLSKAQYQAERLKLDRNARDYNDRARELDARRMIGRNMGM